ncbi:MAG: efflux transporter outer membrane subunit [Georgfuchsia sp.]
MRPSTFSRVAGLLFVMLLAGCAVGPDYHRPQATLPAQYAEAAKSENQTAAATREWWKLFNDPLLDDLVSRAFERNYDLQQAVARIEEATGVMREAGAAQYPEVDLGAAGANSRVSRLTTIPPANPLTRHDYNARLGSAFELDFWGKLRRASEAARAQALGSEYGKGVVELTLAGSVAQTWLALRSLDAQLAVSQETLAARSDSFDITNARFDGGLASGLDVEQARSAKAAAEAQIADLRQQRALAEHQLGLLTATPELAIAAGDLRQLPLPPLPPAGLPSDLLEARPDIRAAEQQLIAANARIGVARAALFPTISLTGSVGSESGALANLFKAGAETWGMGVGLDFPIFAAGKYSARVDEATAQQKQVLAAYQQAIQNGFREVRDALTTSTQRAAGEVALDTQRQAAVESLHLANERYKAGYSPYLEVLDAQRSANDATLAYIRNRQARLAAAIDLFKALGGGWKPAADGMK